jgi:hypothetical protein
MAQSIPVDHSLLAVERWAVVRVQSFADLEGAREATGLPP